MKGHKASKEDTMLLCKYLLKYKAWSTKSALHELKNIDFIKNNYSKNTLYAYMTYTKHFADKGVHPKSSPNQFRKCLEILTKQQPQREEFIELIPEKQPTMNNTVIENIQIKEINPQELPTQDKIQALNHKVELIKTNYRQLQDKLNLKRTELENQVKLLENTYNKMIEQCKNEEEVLQTQLMEEILLKGI